MPPPFIFHFSFSNLAHKTQNLAPCGELPYLVGLSKAFPVQKQQRTLFFKPLSPAKPLVHFIYQMVPNVLSPGEHNFCFIFGCAISSPCRNIDFQVNLWYAIRSLGSTFRVFSKNYTFFGDLGTILSLVWEDADAKSN